MEGNPRVLESGLHAVDSGFQVLDSSICQWNLIRFQIPVINRIPDSLSSIQDSKAQHSTFHSINFLDSGLPKQKFPEFRNPLHGAIPHLASSDRPPKSGSAFDAKRKKNYGKDGLNSNTENKFKSIKIKI